MNTTSSGGRSPWNFITFVFRIADKSLRAMDTVTSPILAPEFQFEAPDIAVMTVLDSDKELDVTDPKFRKSIRLPLGDAFKKMKKEN